MKKFFAIILIAGAVFACSRKTTPASEIIISNKEKEKPTEAVAANTDSTETSAGKTIYTTRCNKCHGLKPVAKYTPAEWENILKVMIPKANLTDSEAKEVRVYVMENARK